MYFDYQKCSTSECDEFISKQICSISPISPSSQEAILILLKELAYYMVKLKSFGAENNVIRDNIIKAISVVITNIDYHHNYFTVILTALYSDLTQARRIYSQMCKDSKIEAKYLPKYLNFGKTINLVDIIKKSEKHYIKRNSLYTFEQKNLFDIMLSLIKSICLKIIQIKSYDGDYSNAYDAILNLLYAMSFESLEFDELKSLIEKSSDEYHKLITELSKLQEERYGKRESIDISFSPRNGKAILVSGIDMTQLEAVLEATKNRGIDVYTHGMTMLMAHTLIKFRSYPNLVGHFGKCFDTSLFDFAAFPGAILMTRYVFQKSEYIYRGRLFTTDEVASAGVVKIEDNNFEPLIQAALQLRGFTKKQQAEIHRVGFRQKVLEEKVQEIISKMVNNEIKHLYIIGLLNQSQNYKDYFKEFLSIIPKDCYALSLAFDATAENILHVDSFYDYLFIYKILNRINDFKPLKELNISIFITKCDQHVIINVINFINMGVKNIFLCKCSPNFLNPPLVDTLKGVFGVKELSTPSDDIKATLNL